MDALNHSNSSIPTDTTFYSRLALAVIVVTLGGGFLWSLLTELNSGAIAMGEIIPSGTVRLVQHFDGGILQSINIHDGDHVEAGQVLITFDSKETIATIESSKKELSSYQNKINEIRQEIFSWDNRYKALETVSRNANEEAKINEQLYKKGFISTPKLLQLNTQTSQTVATMGETAAELARARQKLSELEVSRANAEARRVIAEQKLIRTKILATQNGIINNLKYRTIGGIVPPGGPLFELIPDGEPLIVEAKISPDDIDVVSIGLETHVKLTAYKARSHLTLIGKITRVSSNTFRDDSQRSVPFYKARIEIPPSELKKIGDAPLIPGMLAQVDIISGNRTALRYLIDPIRDSFNRAFMDQ